MTYVTKIRFWVALENDAQLMSTSRYWNILQQRSDSTKHVEHQNPYRSQQHITKQVYDLLDEQKYVHIHNEITTGKIPETRPKTELKLIEHTKNNHLFIQTSYKKSTQNHHCKVTSNELQMSNKRRSSKQLITRTAFLKRLDLWQITRFHQE